MSQKNYTVMVVDDSGLVRRNIKAMLIAIGIPQVLEATNGEDAREIIESYRVDMIISDWNMPAMNGQELLELVRSNEAIYDIPFIMVTSERAKDKVLSALQAGVNNYIVKPFSQDVLFKKIRKYLPKTLQVKEDFGRVELKE